MKSLHSKLAEKDLGKLVDLIVEHAIENNINNEEIKKLVPLFELSEHYGKISTYRWLTGKESIIEFGD